MLGLKELRAIVAKAISAGLSDPERRPLLLAYIPEVVRADLTNFSRSSDQLRGDVIRLNELGLLDAWLGAAHELSPGFAGGSAAPAATPPSGATESPNAAGPSSAGTATEHWSVLIVDEANARLCGSGVVIGPRHILTAEHVVAGADRCCARSQTDGPAHPATVAWRSADLDVALLITDDTIDSGALISDRSRVGSIAGDVYWQAYGYPRLSAKASNQSLQQEGGRTHFWAAGSSMPLALTIPGGPKGEGALNGLSGAGVLIEGRVVAIITQFETARQDRIDAVPLARFFSDPGFRDAAGLRPGVDFEGRRRALRQRMLDCLAPSTVRACLAFHLKVARTMGAEALLDTLLQRRALQVAIALDRASLDLTAKHDSEAPQNAGKLRSLLLTLVPWLVDHRALQTMMHEARDTGTCCFELPCDEAVVIEAMMAGLGERPMHSVHAIEAAEGGPMLRLSSVADAAVGDVDGSASRDGLARELAWTEGLESDGVTPARLLLDVSEHLARIAEGRGDTVSRRNFPRDVENMLAFNASTGDGYRFYLYFDADEAHAASLWRDQTPALRGTLSSLWLVRSTGAQEAEGQLRRHLQKAVANLEKAMPSDG